MSAGQDTGETVKGGKKPTSKPFNKVKNIDGKASTLSSSFAKFKKKLIDLTKKKGGKVSG